MNIGKWIIVTFVLFAMFIGTLVVICIKQDISLVSKQYYRDELIYGDQVQRIANSKQLKQQPSFRMENKRDLVMDFGQDVVIQGGTLTLFRPSDETMDQQFEVNASSGSKQVFRIAALHPGMYRLKVRWVMDGKEFYVEDVLYVS